MVVCVLIILCMGEGPVCVGIMAVALGQWPIMELLLGVLGSH
jgi:hypothetical protein